jgi:hypothetical protein
LDSKPIEPALFSGWLPVNDGKSHVQEAALRILYVAGSAAAPRLSRPVSFTSREVVRHDSLVQDAAKALKARKEWKTPH